MLLLISTSTFVVLATVMLIIWAGLVLWFTGRSRTKKAARPTPALMTFFQPTAGKIAVDLPVPMASYNRSELLPLRQNIQNNSNEANSSEQALPSVSTIGKPSAETLDDPAFTPADPGESATKSAETETKGPTSAETTKSDSASPPTAGFKLSLDRQLLSRLLSDDSLCQQFEEVRALTLDRQRDTGRPYTSLFREIIADKPADVQAVLLNLLTEEEVDDYDRTGATYT